MKNNFDIAIIGGGVAGVITAIACSEAKLKTVFFSPKVNILGGLQIAPNAFEALQKLNCTDIISELLCSISSIRIRDPKKLSDLAFIDLPNNYYSVNQNLFFQRLYQKVFKSDCITLKQEEIVSIEDRNDYVNCISSFGYTYNAKIIIGADGTNGLIRRFINGPNKVEKNYRAIRRSIIKTNSANKLLALNSINLWLGDGWHIVTYPISNGTLINTILVSENFVPEFNFFDESLDNFFNNIEWINIPFYKVSSKPIYHYGKIGLIGNAAHPIYPHLAQGAAQTFIDGAYLLENLKQFGPTREALSHYSISRQENIKKVVKLSNIAGRVMGASGMSAELRNLGIASSNSLIKKYIYEVWEDYF